MTGQFSERDEERYARGMFKEVEANPEKVIYATQYATLVALSDGEPVIMMRVEGRLAKSTDKDFIYLGFSNAEAAEFIAHVAAQVKLINENMDPNRWKVV